MLRSAVRPRRSDLELQKAYFERMHRRFHAKDWEKCELFPMVTARHL